MSALSTSLITVYLQLLPFDCCFLLKNYSLFRITYNLWLYNNYHIIRVYPFVNLINLTKNGMYKFFIILTYFKSIFFPMIRFTDIHIIPVHHIIIDCLAIMVQNWEYFLWFCLHYH